MNESSLGRIYDMITREDCVFGIVSAFRKDLGENQNELNEQRHKELKNEVRKMGYGFVELRGAWKEEGNNDNDIFEKSLIIGKISRDKTIAIGKKYNQDAVIWHGNGKFELIDRNGSVENFAKDSIEVKEETIKSLKELAEKDPEKFKKLFILGSWLKKGSHKNKKFNFIFEAKMSPSVNRGMLEQNFGDERTWIDRFEFDVEFNEGDTEMNKIEEILKEKEIVATVKQDKNHVSIIIDNGETESVKKILTDAIASEISDIKSWVDFDGQKRIELTLKEQVVSEASDEEKQASEMLKQIADQMIKDGVDKKKTDALENAAKVMAESGNSIEEIVKDYFEKEFSTEVTTEMDEDGIAVSFSEDFDDEIDLNKITEDLKKLIENSENLEVYVDDSDDQFLIYIDGIQKSI